jgi:stage III sporulation protein AF
MIAFLSEWMRGLILVIFFAIVLDMILPNNSIQRYARLVMGLLIILLMLSPVLKLAKTPVERMDFTLDSLLSGQGIDPNGETMKSLDEILKEGQQMQEQSARLTVKQWQDRIAERIKRTVEQQHQVTVESVEVRIKADESGRPQDLEGLIVTLGRTQNPREVREVEPVIIGKSDSEELFRSKESQVLSQDATATAADIRTDLAAEYQLKTAQVEIVWRES